MYTLKLRKGGGRTFCLVRTGHTHKQTHRSTYRGGAHLKMSEENEKDKIQSKLLNLEEQVSDLVAEENRNKVMGKLQKFI